MSRYHGSTARGLFLAECRISPASSCPVNPATAGFCRGAASATTSRFLAGVAHEVDRIRLVGVLAVVVEGLDYDRALGLRDRAGAVLRILAVEDGVANFHVLDVLLTPAVCYQLYFGIWR